MSLERAKLGSIREAQDFQQIGQESDELAAVVAETQGWQGQTAKPPIEEIVGDFDFSFRDRRLLILDR